MNPVFAEVPTQSIFGRRERNVDEDKPEPGIHIIRNWSFLTNAQFSWNHRSCACKGLPVQLIHRRIWLVISSGIQATEYLIAALRFWRNNNQLAEILFEYNANNIRGIGHFGWVAPAPQFLGAGALAPSFNAAFWNIGGIGNYLVPAWDFWVALDAISVDIVDCNIANAASVFDIDLQVISMGM